MESFSQKYLEFLNTELKGLNLTRITDPEEFHNKQILDSIVPLNEVAIFKEKIEKAGVVVDVGFGGGFPILPLAYKYPQFKYVGIEARRKKSDAVNLIAQRMGLDNVRTNHLRLEDMLIDVPVVVCLKAVGTVEDYLSKINTSCDVEVFFYKGPNFQELESLDKVLKDWEIIENKEFSIPGTVGRMLIGFKNKFVIPCLLHLI